MGRLMAYSWPGNVRELEHVIERALILSKGKPLTFENVISPDQNDGEELSPLEHNNKVMDLDTTISRHIMYVLKISKGKINGPGGAAELLGINPGTLRHRMKTLGIPYGRRYRDEEF
jgi:DNA-binding NtrC family response regulator